MRMAPIYFLPPEIISVIFEHAKNMTDKIPLTYETSVEFDRHIAFEVTASRVCSYFRQVALATPRLWTSIYVHGASHLESIVEMLRRSGDCWLDIRIDLAVQDPPMDAASLDPIIDNILRHSLRWRSLCMGYSCERQDHPVVMQLCSAPAPGLQHLSITVDDVAEADGTLVNRSVDLPHIFRDGAPELRFIRLRGLAIQLFRPPLSAMVVLHVDQVKALPIQYSTLKGMLTSSPHLTHLSIYGDILAQGGWPNEEKTISVHALRSLRVCSISGEAYAGIMTTIDAPNLEFVTLKDVQEHDLDSLWSITDKVRFETLKSLSFEEFGFSAQTCKHLFETFRQITTFAALYAPAGARKSAIIEVLSKGMIEGMDGNRYLPWPRLNTLCLGPDFYDNDPEGIDTLIAMRKEHGSPISTVIFRVSPEEMEEISPMNFESGADVEVKFCGQDFVWPENSTYFDHDDILFQ